jgi:hypothetical protein
MSLHDERYGRTKGARLPNRIGSACAPWTVLLPDAAEGLLSSAEQRALDQHLAGCVPCSEELAEAQRGLAWLTVLRDQVPEPPSHLLGNILAQTSGYEEVGVWLPPLSATAAAAAPDTALPAVGASLWSWLRGDPGTWSSLLQPRLAMTGAMAFFSICLTLNLLGVSVTQLDAQSLRRGGLHRTVADTGATIVRSIQGIRMVYRVESRVNEMRAEMDDGPAGDDARR